MFLFFSYSTQYYYRTIFFFSLLFLLPLFPATDLPDLLTELTDINATWHGFMRFLDVGKGAHADGMAELKSYFRRFGYLPPPPENLTFTNLFDDEFENALISYQHNLGLTRTGKLDRQTLKSIVSPRCGVADSDSNSGRRIKTTRHFAYFYGEPRWNRPPPMMLTYAFSLTNKIDYVSSPEIKAVFRRAFSRWSAVIPVNFTEVSDYSAADVKIGWYGGDHGDGESFDGVLGVLAHAFSPENGRFHLDAAERWAVDFAAEKSKSAVDLESVATHEIGHVLGLAHSAVKEAIMYPSLSPRTKKVELRMDDVEGVQALYGSNPNYRYNSRLESDTSSGCGVEDYLERRRKGLVTWTAIIVMACLFSW